MDRVDIKPQTDEEFRYWEKVKYVGAAWVECWNWDGAGSKTRHNSERDGKYGRFEFEGRNQPAHRVAWQLLCGPLTPDQHLDHLCDNGLCQNVFHMRPGPLWDNVSRDPKQIAMINRRKTHCIHGHEFTPENTRIWNGHRHCMACARISSRKAYQKKRRGNG